MILWSEGDIQKEEARQKTGVAVYSACAAVFLALSLTLLFLSKDKDYFWYMFADMAIFTLFGWASVWYFANVFADRRRLIRLYKKLSFSEEYREEGVVRSVREITKEGLTMCAVLVETKNGERSLNALYGHGKLFEKGKTYNFTVRSNVVTAWEAADER